MEKKRDKLEDLFRRSLENYSVPGLKPWEEERKLLDEVKRKRRSRRPGFWTFSLIVFFVGSALVYMVLPNENQKKKELSEAQSRITNSGSGQKRIQITKGKNQSHIDKPEQSILSDDSFIKKDMNRKEHITKKRISMNQKSIRQSSQTDLEKARNVEPGIRSSDAQNEPDEVVLDSVVEFSDIAKINDTDLLGHSVSIVEKPEAAHTDLATPAIQPVYKQLKAGNGLELPRVSVANLTAAPEAVDDQPLPKELSNSYPRTIYTGVLVGIDHLVLPRSNESSVKFSSRGFNESPSLSFSGVVQLTPRLLIRSGINIHRFREALTVEINKSITDTVFAVRERPDDIIYTKSTREVVFRNSQQFVNNYTSVSVPILVGYDWTLGRVSVSLFGGFSTNFSLKETAVASAKYSITKSMVSDYWNGMDADLEGYVHYNKYNEYTAEFAPVETSVAPFSVLLDTRLIGRLPIMQNLDVAAEISYAKGITSMLIGNPEARPSVAGAKIGLIYRWKKKVLKGIDH